MTVSDDNTTADISPQENNAIAVINIISSSVTSIIELGANDHSVAGNGLDSRNRDDVLNDSININVFDNLKGL